MAGELILATGLLEQPKETRALYSCLSPYSATREIIKPSDYATTTFMKKFVPRGKCQFHVPACCNYTEGKGYQTMYAFALGTPKKYPELSYCMFHQEVTNSSVGRDGRFNAGTRPLDSMQLMYDKGFFPVTPDCPEFFDRPRPVSAISSSERVRYRSNEWEEVTTREQLITECMSASVGNIGIKWYESDANPGPSGHLPVVGQGRSGGHSVLRCGLIMGYKLSPSGIGILFNNHHGDELTKNGVNNEFGMQACPVWGDDGFGVVPIERVLEGMEMFSCTTLHNVTIRNDDLTMKDNPKFMSV